MSNSTISVAEAPPGIEGAGFFATSLDNLVGLARANSLWPLPFATSCCGIEFMATMGSHYDFARFGSERPSFSPRQADLLMVKELGYPGAVIGLLNVDGTIDKERTTELVKLAAPMQITFHRAFDR